MKSPFVTLRDAAVAVGLPPPPPEAAGRLSAWVLEHVARARRGTLAWAHAAVIASAILAAAGQGDVEACKEGLRRVVELADPYK